MYSNLALAIVFLLASGSAQALEVCYEDRPNPPEYFGSGAKVPKHPGTSIELVQLTAQAMKLPVSFRRLPWKRCLLLLKQGRVDLIPSMGYLPERERFASFPMQGSGPDNRLRSGAGVWHLYKRVGSDVDWNGRKLKNLKGKIGYTSGYSIGTKLEKRKLPAESAPHQEQNLEKLARGRIDLLVGYNQMVDVALLKKPELQSKIEKITPPYQSNSYYMVFSRQYAKAKPLQHKRIWEKMAEIRESARYQSILQQYHSGKLP